MDLYRCQPMSASISKRQCEINRSRELFSCSRCSGLSEAITVQQEQQTMPSKNGICTECKKERALVARGLCGTCYHQFRKPDIAAKRNKKDRPQPAPGKPGGLELLLEQSGYTFDIPYPLMSRLEENGIACDDIICLLEMLLEGKLRRVA